MNNATPIEGWNDRASISRAVKSIPTTYKGVNFRSRLEATWAAFFDTCGWEWSYEPVDLDGWIPDFALGWMPTLVEVKPFYDSRDFDDVLAKVTRTGFQGRVVLLGVSPFDVDLTGTIIGWLATWIGDETTLWNVEDLHIGWTEGNDQLGLCAMEGAWVNLIWPAPQNISHPNKWARVVDFKSSELGFMHWHARNTVIRNWTNAGNAARYQPR